MDAVLLVVVTFIGYLVAYHTYGRFLAKKIFRLEENATTPSVEQEDGIDYVPTRKGIIFGHHYTSIAGTGPIVGPAIGIIWGWVPALIWVFVGSIAMGAVHDFGAVVISMRNRGKSIAECAGECFGPRVHYIFFAIIFLLLLIVIAIFGVVIAVIFKMYPQAVFSVWMEIPIALALGWAIYKKQLNVVLATVVAVFLMYVTVVMGHWLPLSVPEAGLFGIPPTGVWVVVLLIYAFVASSLSVKTLLQPRDYINAWQLFIAMGLLILGVLWSGLGGELSIVAPAYNDAATGAPPMLPFLFVTIACGAISGFHCLVATGTTSKQIRKETDAQLVGYGSMLAEAALATLVIVAVAAGIGMAYESGDTVLTGRAAWDAHYATWAGAKGLPSKINAVVYGSANMIASLGIPRHFGIIIMGVFIASFAGTTLDSATRIQRYVVSEIFGGTKLKFMANRYLATAFVVLTAAALAFTTGVNGKGAMTLWPMFGAGNQLIAALALLVITNHLRRQGRKYLVTAIPFFIMLILTMWSVVLNQCNFVCSALYPKAAGGAAGNWLLAAINGTVFILGVWIVIEGLISLLRPRTAQRAINSG